MPNDFILYTRAIRATFQFSHQTLQRIVLLLSFSLIWLGLYDVALGQRVYIRWTFVDKQGKWRNNDWFGNHRSGGSSNLVAQRLNAQPPSVTEPLSRCRMTLRLVDDDETHSFEKSTSGTMTRKVSYIAAAATADFPAFFSAQIGLASTSYAVNRD